MTKGTQFGLKRGRNALSQKEFHELYGHLGHCKDCKICQEVKGNMRRIKTKHNPHRESRPGYAWAMDCITFSHRSEEGNKYLVVLRCLATGAFQYIPLYLKSDAKEAFREWVTQMRNDPLYKDFNYPVVCYVRTDNAGEWGPVFEGWQEMCNHMPGGKVTTLYVDPQRHAEENGYAEVACGITEVVIKSLLYERNLPPSWWQRCAADALFLLNRFPVVSSDVAVSLDGDMARPLELLTRFCYSRRQIDRELSYYVPVGTPCLVHDHRIKGSALRPKTRWGIACGMYREQVWFYCPFTKSKWRSKSYSAYRLKSGVNPWQFLKLPEPKSSRKAMDIPSDINDQNYEIKLRQPQTDTMFNFIEVQPRPEPITDFMEHLEDDPKQESGGSIRVVDHENRLLEIDQDDGEMYFVDEEGPQTKSKIKEVNEMMGKTIGEQKDEVKTTTLSLIEEQQTQKQQNKIDNKTERDTSINISSPMVGEIPTLARVTLFIFSVLRVLVCRKQSRSVGLAVCQKSTRSARKSSIGW
jgi:hypothetical protein